MALPKHKGSSLWKVYFSMCPGQSSSQCELIKSTSPKALPPRIQCGSLPPGNWGPRLSLIQSPHLQIRTFDWYARGQKARADPSQVLLASSLVLLTNSIKLFSREWHWAGWYPSHFPLPIQDCYNRRPSVSLSSSNQAEVSFGWYWRENDPGTVRFCSSQMVSHCKVADASFPCTYLPCPCQFAGCPLGIRLPTISTVISFHEFNNVGVKGWGRSGKTKYGQICLNLVFCPSSPRKRNSPFIIAGILEPQILPDSLPRHREWLTE